MRTIAFVAILLLLVGGCGDETTNNIYNTDTAAGGVFGRVSPPEAGVLVSAWQSEQIASTATDAEGYFTLENLPPGLYEVRFAASDDREKVLGGIAIEGAGFINLGSIILASSWPIVSFYPADGDTVVPAATSLELRSEVELDLSSLDDAVVITPPVSDSWSRGYDYSGRSYIYALEPTSGLLPDENYHVHITEQLALADGGPWGDTLSFSFRTAPMALTEINSSYDLADLSPGHSGWLCDLRFNAYVDESTLLTAVRIEPDVPFTASLSQSNLYTVRIEVEGDFACGADYSIIVDTALHCLAGAGRATPDAIGFHTEPLRVVYRSYNYSPNALPPRPQTLFEFDYNSDLDPETAEDAVSVDPPLELQVEVSSDYYSDTRELRVSILSQPTPGETYTVTIDSTLASSHGGTTEADEMVVLKIQPLTVTQIAVSNGSGFYETQTTLSPFGAFYARIRFNAEVDENALNDAVTIDPPLPGFWYFAESYYDVGYYDFFPTQPVQLFPEQSFTITIDGDAPLIGSAALGEDKVFAFGVAPVAVAGVYPAPGTRTFYWYDDPYFRFNAPMERTSTESAIRFTTMTGTPVNGVFQWSDGDKRVSFNPTASPVVGQAYVFHVDTSAASVAGPHLKYADSTFFTVGEY
ncbi:MAG: carboxypeptidase-like regulatory domain-containing protein [candidate division Zixibacteria bacterium]|nr:carboxypeptidase-like regulatory domain-containing protein [candidate division Zixibacteria bacterium]